MKPLIVISSYLVGDIAFNNYIKTGNIGVLGTSLGLWGYGAIRAAELPPEVGTTISILAIFLGLIFTSDNIPKNPVIGGSLIGTGLLFLA